MPILFKPEKPGPQGQARGRRLCRKGFLEPAGAEAGPTKTRCLANDIAQSVGPASVPAMYATVTISKA
jgi:hypothetical protein